MIENIKTLLGLSSTDYTKDQLINVLIQQCTDEARDYTHRDDIYTMCSVIEQMVVYRYNRLGTEGLSSESYSGLTYNYSDTYPENIIAMLKKYRKVVAL